MGRQNFNNYSNSYLEKDIDKVKSFLFVSSAEGEDENEVDYHLLNEDFNELENFTSNTTIDNGIWTHLSNYLNEKYNSPELIKELKNKLIQNEYKGFEKCKNVEDVVDCLYELAQIYQGYDEIKQSLDLNVEQSFNCETDFLVSAEISPLSNSWDGSINDFLEDIEKFDEMQLKEFLNKGVEITNKDFINKISNFNEVYCAGEYIQNGYLSKTIPLEEVKKQISEPQTFDWTQTKKLKM